MHLHTRAYPRTFPHALCTRTYPQAPRPLKPPECRRLLAQDMAPTIARARAMARSHHQKWPANRCYLARFALLKEVLSLRAWVLREATVAPKQQSPAVAELV